MPGHGLTHHDMVVIGWIAALSILIVLSRFDIATKALLLIFGGSFLAATVLLIWFSFAIGRDEFEPKELADDSYPSRLRLPRGREQENQANLPDVAVELLLQLFAIGRKRLNTFPFQVRIRHCTEFVGYFCGSCSANG